MLGLQKTPTPRSSLPGGSGADESSPQLHSVIGLGASGQFLIAVDEEIAISETANPQAKPVAERP
jgi:hypothetical protein